jgi:hypothetical protein
MNEDGVGRKANVYVYGWNPKHLLHEVIVTDELIRTELPLWDVPVLRGELVDEQLRPDATILGRRTVHLEIDLNHEGRRQLAKQIDVYQRLNEAEDCVVWLAPTRARLELIRRLAKAIEHVVLFSVLGSGIWEDAAGNRMEAATFCSQIL